ncbi:hypothetical protein IQ07DRAFT_571347 [Pyrenochaeta sp. DS3sAY3a]|nr:hypothetical protein IQ07DRAFT_571347 [Pyrenochaeta sp. DS3sAY3a]
MIEAFKDMKHGKSSSYEGLALERTANQILHRMEDQSNGDSLEWARARVLANARTIYGPNRCLDVISFAPTSSRKIGAAIVEHNPMNRSYIHCASAKEDSRLAAVEHLLVITEDLMQRLIDAEGITSSGWLPATPQAQHAATYSIASITGSTVNGSVASSVPASRRSSVAPQDLVADRLIEHNPQHPHHHYLINDHSAPNSSHHIQQSQFVRGNSDTSFPSMAAQTAQQGIPRTTSEVLQPKPVSVGQFQGSRHGRVQWNLGSEG